MPSRNKSKGKNKKSNAKNKNKKKKTRDDNSTTAKIAMMVEQKCESSEEESDEHFKTEHYFSNRGIISKSLFTEIDCLSPNDIISLKKEVMHNCENKKLKQQIFANLRRDKYKRWLIELKTGFNLLFHGVGSKKSILEDFGRRYCCADPDGIVIRVNGFDDTLTVKAIIDAIVAKIIDKNKQRRTKKNTVQNSVDLQQKAMNIVSYLESAETGNNLLHTYFYLIIHNIDGKVLRTRRIQTIFGILANCKYVHLIASMDHIHSMLLWDRDNLSRFHWIYHEITTYKHYFEEMEFDKEPTVKVTQNDRRSKGLGHIMESLTPQHGEIIKILAQSQVENSEGLDEDEWFCLCEEQLIVSNSLKFEQYINEFLDHNVIVESVERGNTIYTIPYGKEIIQNNLIDYKLND